jgi:glutamate racemase
MSRESSLNQNEKAIGIFDSGIGGLTVMRQVANRLPQESIIYFGDTARVPYGEKSQETILRYCIENTLFLMEQQVKMIVVACNTGAAYSTETLRQMFNIPILDVIEPGIARVAEVTKNRRIAILATKATIRSQVYQRGVSEKIPGAQLFPLACPLFVPLVEERLFNHPATELIVKEYLAPLKDKQVDTVLLGCTHYPLIQSIIQREMGSHVMIVDSATTCAARVAASLADTNQLSSQSSGGSRQFYASDDPERFRAMGEVFFGSSIECRSSVS